MKFELQQAIEILERTPKVLDTLLRGLNPDWVNNNEGPETWSPYDVIGHLMHGERTDWMKRARIILGNDNKPFEPFDRFAQFRESKGKTLNELLDEFATIRKKNLKELKEIGLTPEKLDRTGIHPAFGAVTLRQLLSTWVTHDLAHINQITRVMAKQYKTEIGPWIEYMGIMSR